MDLDDLKHQLKQKLEQPVAAHTAADIAVLLKKPAQSVLDKLTRSLWIELGVSVITLAGFIGISLFSTQFVLRNYFGPTSLLAACFGVLQCYLVLKIKKLSGTPLPVSSNLLAIYTVVSRYVKLFYWCCMVLLPVCLLFSVWLRSIAYSHFYDLDAAPVATSWKPWLQMLGLFLALAVLVHYATRWYLRKLYGDYLNQLHGYIEELQYNDDKQLPG